MARPSNEEAKKSIEHAAFKAFVDKGFNATSYTDIAKASGQTRSLVQYYFPKKEDLIVSFLTEALEYIGEFSSSVFDEDKTPFEKVFAGGQIYYSLLLANENMKRFTFDMISSRYAINKVIQINGQWSFAQMGIPEDKVEQYQKVHIFSSGGMYELLYSELEKGIDSDPVDLAFMNLVIFFVFAYGYSSDESAALLKGGSLSRGQIDAGVKVVLDKVLSGIS